MINATVLQSTLLENMDGIGHAFFTRQGGVSEGVYASLNCGYGSHDTHMAVVENRRRAASHLCSAHEDIVTVHQIHSAKAFVVDTPFEHSTTIPKGDGLVTKTPGLAIGVLSADCTPVLFADPEAKVVGAAHAGWRGAVAGILEATLKAMESIGADRSRIRAAIGPCIHQPNYEVGPDFEAEFLQADPQNERFFKRATVSTKPYFDLPGFCCAKLDSVAVGFIDNINRCTYDSDSLFFSYRRKMHLSESDYGRQISAIVIV